MTFIQTLLAFAVVLGVLIIVHELGHYLVARWCGVKVLRFSVGMGKVVYSRRFGPDQTEWAVSILPLGGYVKMLDARDGDLEGVPTQDLAREFTRQSVRSEEHTSELQSLMRISYAVFCLKKKKNTYF